MNVMIQKPAEREALRVQADREELVERIGRVVCLVSFALAGWRHSCSHFAKDARH